ncbi:MAG: YitT family protein [Bacteroidetes bacterium]|nr:MAG: YitT family protein [Bacteroidota bacterium]
MNPLLKNVVERFVLRTKYSNLSEKRSSPFLLAKGYRNLIISVKRGLKDLLLITLGIFSAAFGLKGFLLTNHFIDGGATGIALLISALTPVPLYVLLIGVNIPFVALAAHVMNRQFAIKTALAIAGLGMVLALVQFPVVTKDNLLIAIFGGFFLGAGIGFAIRGGAVIDGTEVLAIFLGRKFGITIGDVIIVINALIFSVAAYTLGIEIAMYSMITYLAASKTLDFIVEGIEEYIGVTIVSSHTDEIRTMLIGKMGRGVTLYKGKRGYGMLAQTIDVDIIYTVITRLELSKLTTEIEKIDPAAFVVMNSVKDTRGGMIKKRPLQH